jgi:hypothetical protein
VSRDNVNGSEPMICPGQSATADVGAVGDGGQSLKFSGCREVSYEVETSTGIQPGRYAHEALKRGLADEVVRL